MSQHEDDPPNSVPSSVPPAVLESFLEHAREADTEPPPSQQDVMVAVVTAGVLAVLGPTLKQLTDAFHEIRTWQGNADGKIDAIDRGVGSALNAVTNAAAQVERLADAVMALANEQNRLSEEIEQHRKHTIDAYDRLGARVVPLEEYRAAQTGEDNGSIAAAAREGDPPAE